MSRWRWLPVVVAWCIAGCEGGADSEYLPSEPGRMWIYRVHLLNWRDDAIQKQVIRNIGAERDGDARLLRRLRNDGLVSTYRISDEEIAFIGNATGNEAALDATGAQTILKRPYEVGMQWDGGISEIQLLPQVDCGQCNNSAPTKPLTQPVRLHYRIEAMDQTVTVPAGTFSACIHVRGVAKVTADGGHAVGVINVEATSEDWYAPGVGLVKSVRHESSDNPLVGSGTYTLELETFE